MSGYFTVAQALHIGVVETVSTMVFRAAWGSRTGTEGTVFSSMATPLHNAGLSRSGDGVKDYLRAAITEAIRGER